MSIHPLLFVRIFDIDFSLSLAKIRYLKKTIDFLIPPTIVGESGEAVGTPKKYSQ